jgi:hypothetical protein
MFGVRMVRYSIHMAAMENKKIEQGMETAVSATSQDWNEYINGQNTKVEKSIAKQDLEDITARVYVLGK